MGSIAAVVGGLIPSGRCRKLRIICADATAIGMSQCRQSAQSVISKCVARLLRVAACFGGVKSGGAVGVSLKNLLSQSIKAGVDLIIGIVGVLIIPGRCTMRPAQAVIECPGQCGAAVNLLLHGHVRGIGADAVVIVVGRLPAVWIANHLQTSPRVLIPTLDVSVTVYRCLLVLVRGRLELPILVGIGVGL